MNSKYPFGRIPRAEPAIGLQHPVGRRRIHGYAQVEYLLGTLVLTLFMFGDIPGQDHSVADLVIGSIQGYWQSTLLLVGLP